MKLKSLKIENFRCFQSLPIELEPDLMVFVGGNGSGKTALLAAISLLLRPILAGFPLHTVQRSRSLTSADIRIVETDIQAPYAYLAASANWPDGRLVNWDLTQQRDGSPTTKSQLPKDRSGLKQLNPVMRRIVDAHNQSQPYVLPVFVAYGANRAGIPEPQNMATNAPKAFRRLMGLEHALNSNASFSRLVSWFDQLEQSELREQRDGQISEASNSLNAVRRAIETMIPGVSRPRIDSKSGRFAIDFNDSERSIKLQLDQLSAGYQVMLGVVMDLALRLSLANPPQSPDEDVLKSEGVVLIDEVDLHLHPVWQQRVVLDLRRTFPNIQFLLTTHSPQVATTVPSRSLRILKDGQLFAAPAGTEGAEAERMLEDVFGAKARPNVPMARKLMRYLDLVDNKKWESEEAKSLRKELDAWSQGQEPLLMEADLRIENFKWEASA